MIAGPNQAGRTLIELYASKLSADPKSAAELFNGAGRAQFDQMLPKLQAGRKYRITAHLPAQGEDNHAEMTVEGPGAAAEIHTLRFRTDGHALTDLQVTASRKG